MYRYLIKFSNCYQFKVYASTRYLAVKKGAETTRGLLSNSSQIKNLEYCRKDKEYEN